jgi:gamma-glutamyltranspeptidase/glutathione hydrolase
MAGWEAHYEEPVGVDYGDWRVLKSGFWGQGPVFLQQLKILEGLDLAQYDPDGPDFIHLVSEAAKLALADREAYYGDPNFVRVPADVLLSPEYAARRRAEIGERASAELKPGQIDGYDPRVDFTLAERPDGEADISMGGGEPVAQDSLERQMHMVVGTRGAGRGDTCHIDVIDRWGNMVSATPSGAWLQSSPTIPELGFCLNSRAQMFWLEDGVPATLAPGKRPRTTLSVNLALKDGKPAMVFGTPGGDYQDQWTLTFFLRYVHHDAVDRPSDVPHRSHALLVLAALGRPRLADAGGARRAGDALGAKAPRTPGQPSRRLVAGSHLGCTQEQWPAEGRCQRAADARLRGGALSRCASSRCCSLSSCWRSRRQKPST